MKKVFLGKKGLGVKLLGLALASLFLGSCYATSSCSAGAITTCTCPNGKQETYPSNSDRLKEAIKDPKSCCYSKPYTSPTTGSTAYDPISTFGVKPVKQPVAVPSSSEQEIPYEVMAGQVRNPMAVEIPYEKDIPYETVEPVKEKPKAGFLTLLQFLARTIYFHIPSF